MPLYPVMTNEVDAIDRSRMLFARAGRPCHYEVVHG